MPVLRTKPSSSDITLNLSQNTTANITLTFPALHMNNNVTIYNLDGSVNSEFTVTFPIEITMEDVTFSKITLNDSQFNYEVFYTLQLNNYQTNTEYQTAISQSYMNVTTIPYTAPPVFAFGSISYNAIPIYTDQGYTIPITVSNNQDTATGTNFQLLLQFTPSSLSSYINPNCQNIAFYDSNNNKLYSWIENATSSTTSGSVNIWINLGSNNINPSSNITIYMAIGNATTVNYLDNPSNVGAQPNYTSTYAEYDNGSNVFTDYQSWGGLTALPTGWTNSGFSSISFDATYTSTTQSSGTTESITMAYTPSYPFIFDIGIEASSAGGGFLGTGLLNSNSAGASYLFGMGWNTGSGGETDALIASADNYGGSSPLNSVSVWSSIFTSDSALTAQLNYSTQVSATGTAETYGYLGWFQYDGDISDTINVYWTRTRAYPPNGVMPSITFGSVQTAGQSTITIYPTNTGLLYFKGQVYNTGSSAATFQINNPDGSTAYSLEVPASSPPETFEFYSPNWEINFQYVFTFTNNVTFNYFLCRETY